MVKLVFDYELEGIDINIKCSVLCLGQNILKFNCKTRHEDTAEETIQEVFKEWVINGGSLKDACKRQSCEVY